MAITIHLDIDEIRKINNDIKSNDSALEQYLNDLESKLDEIKSNVRSTYVHPIIGGISSEANAVCDALKTHLRRLEDFLDGQLTAYLDANNMTREKLDAALNKMNDLIEEFSSKTMQSSSTVGSNIATSTADIDLGGNRAML